MQGPHNESAAPLARPQALYGGGHTAGLDIFYRNANDRAVTGITLSDDYV